MVKKKVFSIGTSLAKALEESIESAQNYSGQLHLGVIPLHKLEADPDNPRDLLLQFEDIGKGIDPNDPAYERKTQELKSLTSLANSIKSQGIINPIIVYKHLDKYRLVAGERRTLASLLAGKIDIQARILDTKPDELKIGLLQWIENVERKDLSLWERLKNLEKVVIAYSKTKGSADNKEITITELSNLLGCVKSHAISYKAVLNADEALKQLIFDNKIKNLAKAAAIAQINDVEARQQAIEACLSGSNIKNLNAFRKKKISRSIKSETRGRQTIKINLGFTKNLRVAKLLFTSLLESKQLSHFSSLYDKVDWNNYRSANNAFSELMKKIEKLYA